MRRLSSGLSQLAQVHLLVSLLFRPREPKIKQSAPESTWIECKACPK